MMILLDLIVLYYIYILCYMPCLSRTIDYVGSGDAIWSTEYSMEYEHWTTTLLYCNELYRTIL
jgi:hypothetical protein